MFHETDGILAEIQEMDKENEMILNIMLDEGAIMPDRGHAADAGMDLMTPKRVVVPARGSASIDTGVHVEIPEGYFGKLESKSGLNVKHSVVSLGGVVDSGYTGSIVVKLYNLSDEDYVFKAGDKVVQMIIQPCAYPKLCVTKIFKKTERGNGGFGSTGR
jgi:dUTP pyrophosphatase